jgi:hypothetical protein
MASEFGFGKCQVFHVDTVLPVAWLFLNRFGYPNVMSTLIFFASHCSAGGTCAVSLHFRSQKM